MALTLDEAKQIVDRDAAEKKIAKARELQDARVAEEKKAAYEFLKRHTGTAATLKGQLGKASKQTPQHDIYYDNEANRNLMLGRIRARGLSVTLESLEEAFAHLRDTGALCQPPDIEPATVVETVEPTSELKAERLGETSEQLTNKTTPNYTRIRDRERGRDSMGHDIAPTHHSIRFEEPPVHLNLTKKEIIAMPKDEYKRLLERGGKPVRDEINRILAGRPAVQ